MSSGMVLAYKRACMRLHWAVRSPVEVAYCWTTISRASSLIEALYTFEGTREINALIVGRAITGVSVFV